MSVRDFLAGFIRDPNTHDGSSTRLAGLLCTVTGCAVAVIGVWIKYDGASAVVVAVLGGGAATFFARAKGDSSSSDEPPK